MEHDPEGIDKTYNDRLSQAINANGWDLQVLKGGPACVVTRSGQYMTKDDYVSEQKALEKQGGCCVIM